MTSKKSISNQYGPGVNQVEAMQPEGPYFGVEPAADSNIIKVAADSLFVRSAEGSIYGGRRGMSWWATIITVFVFFFFSGFEYGGYLYDTRHGEFEGGFLEHYFLYWHLPIGGTAFFFLACSWLFIPWRRQLPIIFNRRTGMVTTCIKGKVVSEQWPRLEAYIKDITSIAASGVAVNEGILTLGFEGGRKYIGVYATQDSFRPAGSRRNYGAAQLWEFIRLYMRQGASSLPPSCAITPYRISHVRQAIHQFNPLKVLRVSHPAWLLLAVPFFFFIALPSAPLIILGDIIYMWLDHVLPRRRWPQELIDACDGVWDGQEG
ncbi:DUF6708 domain-containing protein [Pseudomonas aeruginosa]